MEPLARFSENINASYSHCTPEYIVQIYSYVNSILTTVSLHLSKYIHILYLNRVFLMICRRLLQITHHIRKILAIASRQHLCPQHHLPNFSPYLNPVLPSYFRSRVPSAWAAFQRARSCALSRPPRKSMWSSRRWAHSLFRASPCSPSTRRSTGDVVALSLYM